MRQRCQLHLLAVSGVFALCVGTASVQTSGVPPPASADQAAADTGFRLKVTFQGFADINFSETGNDRSDDGKKELEMFCVTGIQPALLAGAETAAGGVPPAFAQRYRTYFSKEVPLFPAFLLQPAAHPPEVANTPQPISNV